MPVIDLRYHGYMHPPYRVSAENGRICGVRGNYPGESGSANEVRYPRFAHNLNSVTIEGMTRVIAAVRGLGANLVSALISLIVL